MSSALEGLNCTNCGRYVKYQVCKSDKNGNKGILFATCHSANDKGEKCSFIRRASKSPTASPTISSQPIFQAPIPIAPIAQARGKCPIANCGQTRLADDCQRRVCRKHCLDLGGCISKTHKHLAAASSTTAISLPPPSTSFMTTSAPPPPSFSVPSSPPNHLPSPDVVDARADPRFATHLRPIFTEIIAEQQEKSRQQNVLDAERQENARKSKQHVAVYPWTKENTAPIVKIFQNFPWPYLTISPSLLSTIGLLDAGERGDLRMYDEAEIFDWVAVDMGYIMEVHEGQRLFLKDGSIRNCTNLQKSLDTCPRNTTPHLHNHLPRERAYARELLKMVSPPCSPQQIRSSASSSLGGPTPSPPATPDPTPSPLHSPLPTQGEASRAGGTGGPDDPIELVGEEKHWPTDYYTFQIANCMRECSSRTHRVHQRSSTRQAVFLKHFPGVRFVPSTFSNQRDLWQRSSATLKDEFIELGQCKEGLWSAFAKCVRQEQKAGMKMADIIDIF